ncbi:MAG: hypothetical protein ACJAUP_001698 [Cellvibrionaceae bacterium]|jgi:hypothetical protein
MLISITSLVVWLSIISTVAVIKDKYLDTFQATGQLIFCWLMPIVGATFVLKTILEYDPDIVNKKLIPWSFGSIVFSKETQSGNGIAPSAEQAFDIKTSQNIDSKISDSYGSDTSGSD